MFAFPVHTKRTSPFVNGLIRSRVGCGVAVEIRWL